MPTTGITTIKEKTTMITHIMTINALIIKGLSEVQEVEEHSEVQEEEEASGVQEVEETSGVQEMGVLSEVQDRIYKV